MATYSSILAGIIPWTEEPGRLKGLQKVRHDWACMHVPLTTSEKKRHWVGYLLTLHLKQRHPNAKTRGWIRVILVGASWGAIYGHHCLDSQVLSFQVMPLLKITRIKMTRIRIPEFKTSYHRALSWTPSATQQLPTGSIPYTWYIRIYMVYSVYGIHVV